MTEVEWLTSTDPGRMLRFATARDVVDGSLCIVGVTDRKLRLFACACCRVAWPLLTDERSRRAIEVAERFADGLATDEELTAACRFAGEVAGPSDDAWWWAYVWAAGGHVRQAIGRVECVPAAAQAGLLRDVCGNPFRPVALPFVCGRCGLPHGRGGPGCGGPMVCPWLTPDVRALARTCYDERGGEACGRCQPETPGVRVGLGDEPPRVKCHVCAGTGRVVTTGHLDPVRLAVLADALEEAGCTDVALLGHLRGLEPCRICANPNGRMSGADRCKRCRLTPGWVTLRGPHVRGCHALDAVLGLS